MPELPEVETVRRGLDRYVVGRTIASVALLHPRAARRHVAGGADFECRLVGRRVNEACRRGKYLWLPLGDAEMPGPGEALLVHLGMSGQMLVDTGTDAGADLGAAPVAQPAGPAPAGDGRHVRARFGFADGGPALRFVDQRTFGGLFLDLLSDGVPISVRHIARDPLDAAFDDDDFVRRLLRRRTSIKRALLDQTVVSGIGNIYADEALWRARLHGDSPVSMLAPADVHRLLSDVRDVLRAAVAAGGTSFDALYVNVNGSSGWFECSLQAYGRTGRPCARCGTPIVREAFMNRSSFRCPVCQPAAGQ